MNGVRAHAQETVQGLTWLTEAFKMLTVKVQEKSSSVDFGSFFRVYLPTNICFWICAPISQIIDKIKYKKGNARINHWHERYEQVIFKC